MHHVPVLPTPTSFSSDSPFTYFLFFYDTLISVTSSAYRSKNEGLLLEPWAPY